MKIWNAKFKYVVPASEEEGFVPNIVANSADEAWAGVLPIIMSKVQDVELISVDEQTPPEGEEKVTLQ